MRKGRAAGDCSGALTYCSGGNAMARSARAQMSRTLGGVVLAAAILSHHSALANDANVVLYNQHTAEKGETEIEVFSDVANVGSGEPNYTAQLFELEHGFTDLWTSSLYLEGAKTEGESYDYASFRFENRVRLSKDVTFFNPVLYAEYEQKEPASQFITAVVGRTDEPEGPLETEHELETRLIFGHDLTDRLTVAFDWINEIKFDNGLWSFGYATGFSYALFKAEGGEEAGEKAENRGLAAKSWDLEKLTLGVEVYGGVGDADLGLTLDPNKTEQYAGINLESKFDNHFHVTIGGAFGLTQPSQDAILRLSAGYEFE
jgi:hypothetical protein